MKNIADNTDQSRTEISGSYRTPDGNAQIDFGITYLNGYPEYTSSGHFDGSSGQCLDAILAAYPDNVMVQDLHARWSKFHLQDVSKHPSVIDKTRRGAENFPFVSFYETQAQDFLSRNGLKFRATLSDSKIAPWSEPIMKDCPCCHGRGEKRNPQEKPQTVYEQQWGLNKPTYSPCPECHGKCKVEDKECPAPHHFRVTLSKEGNRLTFDFWSSIADAQAGVLTVTSYSVLACISGDAYTPETFADFCAEYGYESDSIKALQQFRRCGRFAKRLRAFFTESELQELSEIQ